MSKIHNNYLQGAQSCLQNIMHYLLIYGRSIIGAERSNRLATVKLILQEANRSFQKVKEMPKAITHQALLSSQLQLLFKLF